jgi:hypothetical protein
MFINAGSSILEAVWREDVNRICLAWLELLSSSLG